MLDALELAELAARHRGKLLPVRETPRPFTCAIRGCPQDAYAWRVTLPERRGQACPACATDAGFEVS